MTGPTNHWKLGLFVIVGAVLALVTAGALGVHHLRDEVGLYVSYFDESVQGLEVGSPIKFRGVTIGAVGKIDVGPDHRHVEVVSELGTEALARLGLDVAAGPTREGATKKLEQAIDLRAQLASAGLTGVKFLQLDFFTVADNPPPALPFPTPKNYIPATSSTMKDLEDSLVAAMSALPQITAHVDSILARIDELVSALNASGLFTQLGAALAGLRETMAQANLILAHLDGDDGLVESVQRVSVTLNDTARTADGLGTQLQDTLRSVDEAAKSIRKLADAIEKEPDMLIKGRLAEAQR